MNRDRFEGGWKQFSFLRRPDPDSEWVTGSRWKTALWFAINNEGERGEDRMGLCAVVIVVDSRLQRIFGRAERPRAAAI